MLLPNQNVFPQAKASATSIRNVAPPKTLTSVSASVSLRPRTPVPEPYTFKARGVNALFPLSAMTPLAYVLRFSANVTPCASRMAPEKSNVFWVFMPKVTVRPWAMSFGIVRSPSHPQSWFQTLITVRPEGSVPSTIIGLWPVAPFISSRTTALLPDGLRWIGTAAGALASDVKQAELLLEVRLPAKPDQSPPKLQVPFK